MKYAMILDEDKRVSYVTFEKYATEDAIIIDALPKGDVTDYKYIDGEFVYDPMPEPEEMPTQLDRIESQVAYTAMMTDTLLEV